MRIVELLPRVLIALTPLCCVYLFSTGNIILGVLLTASVLFLAYTEARRRQRRYRVCGTCNGMRGYTIPVAGTFGGRTFVGCSDCNGEGRVPA